MPNICSLDAAISRGCHIFIGWRNVFSRRIGIKRFEGEVVVEGETHRRAFFQYVRYRDRPASGNAEPLGERFEGAGLVKHGDARVVPDSAVRIEGFCEIHGPDLCRGCLHSVE